MIEFYPVCYDTSMTEGPISGIHHVQLAMPAGGEDTARRFYSGLLGIPEVPKPLPQAKRGGVWLRQALFAFTLVSSKIFGRQRRRILACSCGTCGHYRSD